MGPLVLPGLNKAKQPEILQRLSVATSANDQFPGKYKKNTLPLNPSTVVLVLRRITTLVAFGAIILDIYIDKPRSRELSTREGCLEEKSNGAQTLKQPILLWRDKMRESLRCAAFPSLFNSSLHFSPQKRLRSLKAFFSSHLNLFTNVLIGRS